MSKRWGSLTAARKAVAEMQGDAPKRRGRPPKDPNRKKWTTKLSNKGLDKCPACDFPEAYGGYCPECGWMEPLVVDGKKWVPSAPRGKRK